MKNPHTVQDFCDCKNLHVESCQANLDFLTSQASKTKGSNQAYYDARITEARISLSEAISERDQFNHEYL